MCGGIGLLYEVSILIVRKLYSLFLEEIYIIGTSLLNRM